MTIVDKTFLAWMVKYTIIMILTAVLFGCSPWRESPLTDQQITALNGDYAVAQWKASKAATDECSSPALVHWIASKYLKKNWSDCCWQHDFDYHYGYLYGITEDQADYELWECVKDSGHPVVANIIYDAVWVFGSKSYRTGEK